MDESTDVVDAIVHRFHDNKSGKRCVVVVVVADGVAGTNGTRGVEGWFKSSTTSWLCVMVLGGDDGSGIRSLWIRT